jgi:shikimate kinase
VDKEILLKRLVDETSNRPLLQEKNREELIQFIDEELTERESVYSKADWVIDANGTVEEILQRIGELI